MSVPHRVAPYLVAVLVAIASIVGLMWRPSTVSAAHRADYVIIAGAAGLRWDDVNPIDTPTLWALAQRDSIAALTVRSAHDPTCPVDGWLTLGAGNYTRRSHTSTQDGCPAGAVPVSSPDRIGANVADQARVVVDNRALSYGAQPGALAESVRCTAAVGTGAAIAAARPFGRVDRYEAALPKDPTKLLSTCVLSIVDLGTVDGTTPLVRRGQARTVDALLARVLAARPQNSLVLVAGLSDTRASSRLHVVIADGPGYQGGWLTSASTGRSGYLQLVDLAPTALAALGRSLPVKLFAGAQAQQVGARPPDPTAAVSGLADADDEARVQHTVAGRYFWILVAGEIALLFAAVPLLRRARRSAEPYGPRAVPPRVVRVVEGLFVAAAVSIVAALLADIVPWWRAGTPGWIFAAVGAGFAGLVTAGVTLVGPWRYGALGPLAAVTAVITAVIGIDVLSGSRLQLNGVAGYSATSGERYSGIGPVALGAFIVGVMLLAACLAQIIASHGIASRQWRPAIVGALGALGVIVVGSPYFGADAGGAVALTAGVCIAAAIASGGWLTFARFAWATLFGMVVLVGFAALDLRRPVAQRGTVGRFLTELHQGTAGIAFHRTAVADVVVTATSPLSLLVIAAIVFNMLILVRSWGGLMRVFGLYPAVRGAMVGIAVAAVLAGLLDGVGFMTAGAAAAVALPLVTLASLRVLDHADDRTAGRAARASITDPVPVAVLPEPPATARTEVVTRPDVP